jgi:L-ribulose-5-phosphate 4-epimerase
MLEELKKRVFEQNLALVKHNLVVLTWGNVSAIDRKNGLVVIKPSGVSYAEMKAEDMVVVDPDGKVVEGKYRPSSDTPTHIELYKSFPEIGGVVHTHSTYATAWAQAGRNIPAYGTTHADAFYGDVPCTRALTKEEIESAYELNTGKVIAETFRNKNYEAIPAVLVKNHGPFTWGQTPEKAVENAVTLEAVSQMATLTEKLNPKVDRVDGHLLDKHYYRKHGANAYYGQKK